MRTVSYTHLVDPVQIEKKEAFTLRQIGDKVSYVRNPFARNSYYCLTLAVLGLALGTASMYLSVARAGQGGLNTGAYGFSSLAAALMGLWYGVRSFKMCIRDRIYRNENEKELPHPFRQCRYQIQFLQYIS